MQAGDPVIIVGEGRTRHTFIAEHDVAQFVVAAVNNPAAANRRLAIGGPAALSWRDVVATYEKVLGRAIDVQFHAAGHVVGKLAMAVQPLLAVMDHFESTSIPARRAEFGVSRPRSSRGCARRSRQHDECVVRASRAIDDEQCGDRR